MEYIPDAVTKLPSSFGDMDFKLARRCIKKLYSDAKTLDQYLQENGVLRIPLSEDMEMLECVEILSARYQKSGYLLTKVGDLIAENPDLPIRKLNKYIREVIGESKIEKYYIKNGILKGRETDLQEFVYCSLKAGYGWRTYSVLPSNISAKVGDFVFTSIGFLEEITGIQTYLGIDAPYPVSIISTITKIATEDEIIQYQKEHSSNSNNNAFTKIKSEKNICEIFEMEQIAKVPSKAEYIHNSQSFLVPSEYERGFFGTVFQGVAKDILMAKNILFKKGYASNWDLVSAEKEGIYPLCLQCEEDEAVREILRSVPGLKMVTFFAWWDGGCGVYYSHSGYPYITKSLTDNGCGRLYISRTDTYSPWIYRRMANERSFYEKVDFGGDTGTIHYVFTEVKDWEAINYITEIDEKLYRLNGYR